jgi:hypothetical protein
VEQKSMELQTELLKEVLGELFTLLEAQETQSAAVLQFLKDQGIATEEKLAPYLEQAGNGSNVKWRAARKRMEYLLTPIQKEAADIPRETDQHKAKEAEGKSETVSPEPASSKEADQHRDDKDDDKSKNKGAEKPETEMAAKAKAASGSATPKTDNTTTEKTPEPTKS